MVSPVMLNTIVSLPLVALAALPINFIKQPNATAPQPMTVVLFSIPPLGHMPMALAHSVTASTLSFVCHVLLVI
jgi:hypothetical protein